MSGSSILIFILKIVSALIIAVIGILVGLFYKGIDRKLAAMMQSRVGPPVRQPFLDFFKLMIKENIVPENAIPWIFNGAPMLALVSTITILFYIPYGSLPALFGNSGDLILIAYLLAIPAIALVAGGFSSGSTYASIGAQREMVLMMSYELPLVTTIVALGWRLNLAYPGLKVFSLAVLSANPIWSLVGPLGFIGAILLLFTLAIVTPAELSIVPFDIPEAETELAGGILVEYSGRNLALFELANAVKMIVMGALTVVLFFPYNIAHLFSLNGFFAYIVDTLFFFFKLFIVIFFEATFIRVAIARLKIDQASVAYLVFLSIVGLMGLLLIAIDYII
ncbi:MAG: NADH-quinone oxidoreductase subunit H [Atribacterota bacterium]|nr:NADH-quinone oxidoreductase subunit H [Atribacterota bacterium]MDD4895288.1 NADH-quinone oxidoreductase subunit H [Atribacterota bacterium]MDD5636612.1 NADH-quinone oxidoreductase subunit H [Atribacterota bacterium]